MKTRSLLLASLMLGMTSSATLASVGVTDNCQDNIRQIQDDMKQNKDDYTAEARTRADAQLTEAKTNLVNPAKCHENVLNARSELAKGKVAKKRKD